LTELLFGNGLDSLKTVDISDNLLKELSLVTLSSVESINAADNVFEDMSGFVSSTLKSLDASGNSIGAVISVAPLLAYLDISDNPIKETGDLALLTGLTSLYAENVKFSDISFLSSLPQLRALFIDLSNAESIAALIGLSGLEELTVYGYKGEHLSVFSGLIRLKRLTFIKCSCPDPRITGFQNLAYLGLVDCSVSDLSGITALPVLSELYISGGRLTEPALSDLPALEKLTVEESGVIRVSGIYDLPNLKYMLLGGNIMQDLSFSLFPKLMYVDLSYNSLRSVDGLNLIMLNGSLDLSGNPLNSVNGLSSLPRINVLDLSDTGVKDVSGLDGISINEIILG